MTRVAVCIAPAGKRRAPCTNPTQPGSLFCRTHERAPAAKRGGWISAERRRRKLAAADQAIDAANITTRLWVGCRPPADRDLPEFDVLVLCALEYQPNPVAFHGQVMRCPLPDAQLTDHQVAHALMVARAVATSLTSGRRVLISCANGLNRSTLVAALALMLVTRMGADELVELIQRTARRRVDRRRSRDAPFNPHFHAVLRRVAGAGRAPYRS